MARGELMTFFEALRAMHKGKALARGSWPAGERAVRIENHRFVQVVAGQKSEVGAFPAVDVLADDWFVV